MPPKKAVAKGGKKESAKKKKDPKAPKRPMTGYFLYCQDKRPEVKKQNPDAKVGEIAKILGEMWAKEPESVKEKYKQQHAKAKAAYDKELAEYKKTKTEESEEEEEEEEEKPKKRKATKAAAKPTKKAAPKKKKKEESEEEEEEEEEEEDASEESS
eukprot:GEZU01013467.1.p1 GENE.GEZU01013467.1~~GEZU01013467.1.p1  ORF type:complete len:156 (-),score=108.28 GEZU01013467.1:134-601(-)